MRLRFDPWVRKTPWRRESSTHSSSLARRIPWTEEPCRLQFMESQRAGCDWYFHFKIWQYMWENMKWLLWHVWIMDMMLISYFFFTGFFLWRGIIWGKGKALINIYLFICLFWVFVTACRICIYRMQNLSCGMWNIVHGPDIEPGLPALRAPNLSYQTTRAVPPTFMFCF